MSQENIELHLGKSALKSFESHCARRGMSISEGVNDLLQQYNQDIETLEVELDSDDLRRFQENCKRFGLDAQAMMHKLIEERVYRHNLNQKMLELQAEEDEDRQFVFKVPVNLLGRYSKICQEKDIPMAREFRHFIREEVARHDLNQEKGGA